MVYLTTSSTHRSKMNASVIIPTYNYGQFIEEAVRSVLCQTFDDFEVIVIDDGSTDETPEVLSSIVDSRLQVRRTSNSGVAAARNLGLDMARGKVIAFLDGDDRWHPRKLERQVAVMRSEPDVGALFTDFTRFSATESFSKSQFAYYPELHSLPRRLSAAGGGYVITADAFSSLVAFNQFPTWPQTTMVRADDVRALRFRSDFSSSEDLHYLMRVYQRTSVAYISEPLVEVRRHGSNSYQTQLEKMEADIEVLIALELNDLSPTHRAALRRRLGRAWCGIGYFHFHNRNVRGAAEAYTRALVYPGCRSEAMRRLAGLPMVPLLSTSHKTDWSEPCANGNGPEVVTAPETRGHWVAGRGTARTVGHSGAGR